MTTEDSSILLVLNPNIEIVSVREFPMDIRERLGGSASDFIISDNTSRIVSQRIDNEVAMFLRRFREPRRIVEAVFEHSTELDRDALQVLSDIYPLITKLRISTILIDPTTIQKLPLGPMLIPGEYFEGYRIIEQMSGLAETDIYKAESDDGSLVAIKYLRSGSDESVKDNLRHETEVLKHANTNGCLFTPRLHFVNLERDDPYICLEWFEGQTLFAMIRSRNYNLAHRAQVVTSLVDAYADLNKFGILHGDVHPCNIIILKDGRIRLIDFGGSQLIKHEHSTARIGLVHYYEPEVARKVLVGQLPPSPSTYGEQYCVASLAYSVLTGGSYLALSLETENALNQIANQPPRRFEEMGILWPIVEQVISRALNKYPENRFETFSAFREALLKALDSGIPSQDSFALNQKTKRVIEIPNHRKIFDHCIHDFKKCYGLNSNLVGVGFSRGPKASLYAGSAGIAYGLLRIACLQQDADLLAAADVWISRALNQQNDLLAFTDGSVSSSSETGPLALFHSVTGLHTVNALIRYASGDRTETRKAIMGFIQMVESKTINSSDSEALHLFPQDLTNGVTGLLLGLTLLLPLCDKDDHDIRLQIETLASHLCTILHQQFQPDIQCQNRFLGFAHGRTGAIYALLKWADVSSNLPDRLIISYLDDLAVFTHYSGEGLSFPIDIINPNSPSWTGWCHGSAGHLLTWTLAARVLKRKEYLSYAISLGRNIWELNGQSGPSLCCGSAGEALSLFELSRATGDSIWIDRGIKLSTQAVNTLSSTNDAQGLLRSGVGIALTAAESREPTISSWPICQSPL